jgi:hypothetical protein
MNPYGCIGGGGGPWGGLTPYTSLSQACIPPPKEGVPWFLDLVPGSDSLMGAKGATPKGQTLWGVFPE